MNMTIPEGIGHIDKSWLLVAAGGSDCTVSEGNSMGGNVATPDLRLEVRILLDLGVGVL